MQGESMDAEPARLIIEALKEEKIDLYVTLPEEPTVSLTQAVQADPYVQCVMVASEDGRVALTAGSPAEPPDRRVGFFIKTKRDSQFRRCCAIAPAIEKVGQKSYS
jgi:hypothetical protein